MDKIWQKVAIHGKIWQKIMEALPINHLSDLSLKNVLGFAEIFAPGQISAKLMGKCFEVEFFSF